MSVTMQRDPTAKSADEAAERQRKAFAIAVYLRKIGAHTHDATGEALLNMTDEWWTEVARLAGRGHRKPPSATTRAMVVEMLLAIKGLPEPGPRGKGNGQ